MFTCPFGHPGPRRTRTRLHRSFRPLGPAAWCRAYPACARQNWSWLVGLVVGLLTAWRAVSAVALEPVPDKLVVLTFDDSAKSHFTVVRPLLKQYGFGATFFITEGFDFKTNRRDYMSWDEIAQLHRDGFEIGNHTRDHLAVRPDTLDKLPAQLEAIRERCREHGISAPTTFAYPGNAVHPDAFAILRKHGILFARRGGSPEHPYAEGRGAAYEPHLDHPLLIPTAGDARPTWTTEDFIRAVETARHGRIAVLQFHGVPDTAHDWVSSSPEKFATWLNYLATHKYQVVALRDLAKYVDPQIEPTDAQGPIADRAARIKAGLPLDDFRPPVDDADLRRWLDVMVQHRLTVPEITAATGLDAAAVVAAIDRFGLRDRPVPSRAPTEPLRVVPYPGGRHPRAGFRDGALRPQRETKVSVFTPWNDGGYVVVDVPEAIWFKPADRPQLLYLAHSHIPTYWDLQGRSLERLEWRPREPAGWQIERRLPDGATFAVQVAPGPEEVRFELTLKNDSPRLLTDLRVQNCVLLARAVGFEARTNDNKILRQPLVACRDASGRRWVITAWERCVRAWANPPCPCLHSDPQFPDCPPGETRRLQGWLSFYEGTDIDAELRRVERRWFPERP